MNQVVLRGGLAACGLLIGFLCGCNTLQTPILPNASGVTLGTIEQIQNDPSLTQNERQAMLRDMLGVEDDEAGNRLVNFLLALQVPPETPPGEFPG